MTPLRISPWPSLSAGQLAGLALGLVGLVLLHRWSAGLAMVWASQDLPSRTLVLHLATVANAITLALLLGALLVSALRCDQHNDLRFLSVLGGSVLGLLLLLGAPSQRFDRVAYDALVAAQAPEMIQSPLRQPLLEAVRSHDMVALHRLMESSQVALDEAPR